MPRLTASRSPTWSAPTASTPTQASWAARICSPLLRAAPGWSPAGGQFGGALDLEADEAQFGQFTSTFDIGAEGAMTAWVKLETTGKRHELFRSADAVYGSSPGFEVQIDSSGRPFIYTNLDETEDSFARGSGVNDTGWHHVAFMWNQATQTVDVYVDGALSANKFNGNSWDDVSPFLGELFLIGKDPASSSRYFDGLIDGLAFYSRELTLTELVDVRDNGVAAAGIAETVAHWSFDEAIGSTSALDSISNALIEFYQSGLRDTYLAEGFVLAEQGGDYAADNAGPNPGPLASFDIPFGGNTFDPDPLYFAVLNGPAVVAVPEPAVASLAMLGLAAIAMRRRRVG